MTVSAGLTYPDNSKSCDFFDAVTAARFHEFAGEPGADLTCPANGVSPSDVLLRIPFDRIHAALTANVHRTVGHVDANRFAHRPQRFADHRTRPLTQHHGLFGDRQQPHTFHIVRN